MATDLTQVQKKLWDLDTPLVHVLNQHTAHGTNEAAGQARSQRSGLLLSRVGF